MITLEGKSVFGGVAIGKIQFYKRNEITIKRRCGGGSGSFPECKSRDIGIIKKFV